MKILRKYISALILKEIGRNMHTVNTDPITFQSFPGYDINISSISDSKYNLIVNFWDQAIGDMSVHQNYDEAVHAARMIIDHHRVALMNNNS